MKRRNKNIGMCLIVGMLMLSMFGQMMAYTIEDTGQEADTSGYPADTWLGRLISKIKFIISGGFTIYGRELGCEEYPSETVRFENRVGSRTKTISVDSGEAMFINWFRGSPNDGEYSDHLGDSRQIMEEIYLEDGKTNDESTITCDAGAYWDYDCYYEIYICPLPCYSDLDCSSNEYCDKTILSQKIDNAGVCKISTPTHQTDVYKCEDGIKTSLGKVSFGSDNFCNDIEDINYIRPGDDESGVCLYYEPEICSESSNGSLQTGDYCTFDSDCESLHCDKRKFYSPDTTCQPTPWDEIYRMGFTKEQIGEATISELVGIACIDGKHCLSPDNEVYDSKCISLRILKDDGTLQVGTSSFFDEAKSVINRGALGAVGGALACAGGVVAAIIFAPTVAGAAVFGTVAATTCTTLIAGGAIVGASTAIGTDKKNEIVKALDAEDIDAVGLCVLEEKKGLAKYTGWAAFFIITGDEGIDGLIFILGILFLLRFIGGGRR